MLNIVTAPSSVLSQSAKQISKIDSKILKLIEEMKKALLSARDPIGVGLAAPQVGRSLQIFIAKPTDNSPISVFINPIILNKKNAVNLNPANRKIEKESENQKIKLEGCLSLRDIWGDVKRESNIIISYQDEKGKTHSQKFSGFMATIIQHEYDHLKGILFPKRVLEQKGQLYKSRKDAKGEDIFEEIEI